jgi:hypothetical protein
VIGSALRGRGCGLGAYPSGWDTKAATEMIAGGCCRNGAATARDLCCQRCATIGGDLCLQSTTELGATRTYADSPFAT